MLISSASAHLLPFVSCLSGMRWDAGLAPGQIMSMAGTRHQSAHRARHRAHAAVCRAACAVSTLAVCAVRCARRPRWGLAGGYMGSLHRARLQTSFRMARLRALVAQAGQSQPESSSNSSAVRGTGRQNWWYARSQGPSHSRMSLSCAQQQAMSACSHGCCLSQLLTKTMAPRPS